MDRDRSKKLDFDEFKKGICNYGLDMEPNELTNMFQAFDVDNTGKINIREFLVKLRPPLSISRQTAIQKAFQTVDRTGKISHMSLEYFFIIRLMIAIITSHGFSVSLNWVSIFIPAPK